MVAVTRASGSIPRPAFFMVVRRPARTEPPLGIEVTFEPASKSRIVATRCRKIAETSWGICEMKAIQLAGRAVEGVAAYDDVGILPRFRLSDPIPHHFPH